MNKELQTRDNRIWLIILVILLIGFLHRTCSSDEDIIPVSQSSKTW